MNETTYTAFAFKDRSSSDYEKIETTVLVRSHISRITDMPEDDGIFVMGCYFEGELRKKFIEWWNMSDEL